MVRCAKQVKRSCAQRPRKFGLGKTSFGNLTDGGHGWV